MKLKLPSFSKTSVLQITFYLFVNVLFILKYLPRAGVSSHIFISIYLVVIFFTLYLYKIYSNKISEKIFRIGYWVLLLLMIFVIIGMLLGIDRYSVRVDRWSAVSFFLDNLFRGIYPYSAHTHVSNTNFPSPFPFWYIINIPFYLLGDVGYGLIFFLLLTAIIVKQFFLTYRKSFIFILLICFAPAYWWEVAVRSDSLSNSLLVFVFLLWFIKKGYTLSNNLWLSMIVCGLIASTRLSAILPLALFYFKPFININWKSKIYFILGVLGIAFLTFIPFIFWDTKNWIFFSRNPFMSQTSIGNSYLLPIMIILGCFLAFKWKNSSRFFNIVSLFIFVFIATTQISLILTHGIHGSIFTDSLYDISYFSLLLPYCLAFITSDMHNQDKALSHN